MTSKYIPSKTILFFLLLTLVFSACGGQAPTTVIPSPVIVLSTPTALSALEATFVPATLPTTLPMEKVIGNAVPRLLREQVEALNLPADAGFMLDVALNSSSTSTQVQFQWVYALVAPFPTVRDDVTPDELRAAWSESTLFNGQPLLLAESTLAAFTALWGEPASGSVRSVDESQLLDTAWADAAWAIVPFEELSPRWKALTIDGQAPIRKGFDVTKYPLVVPFSLQPSGAAASSAFNLASSNYDASKLTTVILTGVTALVRATAAKMEVKGLTYPGEDIRDVLREADIAHISNEIPFMTGCPAPNPNSGRLVFCSDPKYIALLNDVGMDVVELTGNHFADYGRGAMEETLSIYKADNIPYFGGGADLQDSFKPALFEVNGNKIAFLGCNRPDVDNFKVASENHSGATPCDFDYLTAKISQLRAEGYLVIFTFQWYEDYAAPPNPLQVKDFKQVADAGATIVSGSQAHYAKVMEFYGDTFIHYGLGNLFFDQMGNFDWMPEGIRREFYDRYVVYNGQLISVELITGLLEDFSRPRLMTEEERAAFLQEYFFESGWASSPDAPVLGSSVP